MRRLANAQAPAPAAHQPACISTRTAPPHRQAPWQASARLHGVLDFGLRLRGVVTCCFAARRLLSPGPARPSPPRPLMAPKGQGTALPAAGVPHIPLLPLREDRPGPTGLRLGLRTRCRTIRKTIGPGPQACRLHPRRLARWIPRLLWCSFSTSERDSLSETDSAAVAFSGADSEADSASLEPRAPCLAYKAP